VTRQIGFGESDFERAVPRVMAWQMHRAAGISVTPIRQVKPGEVSTGVTASQVRVGDVVELRLGFWIVGVSARCMVVDVLDARNPRATRMPVREAGFSYGTLPGHPERGEEAFVVRLLDDGAAVASVAAFSQPARWFSRLAPPVSRAIQREIARRYVSAMLPGGSTQ
jgi:uncharacterized protein (UPF0548 family)